MRIYHEWLRIKLDGNESSGSWCRRCGIDEQRLYELTKLRSQFLRILKVQTESRAEPTKILYAYNFSLCTLRKSGCDAIKLCGACFTSSHSFRHLMERVRIHSCPTAGFLMYRNAIEDPSECRINTNILYFLSIEPHLVSY